MITESSATLGIFIIAVTGIIYFGIVTIISKILKDEQQQLQYKGKPRQYEYSTANKENAYQTAGYNYNFDENQPLQKEESNSQQNQNRQNMIHQLKQISNIYIRKLTICMIIFGVICWLVFFLSFSAKYSIYWSFISLVMGMLTVFLITIITIKLSLNAGQKFLDHSQRSRGAVYFFGWGTGTALSVGIVSIQLFIQNFLISISKYLALDEEQLGTDILTQFYFCMMGYVWGILCGAIFYRQIGAEVGRGLISGSDMIASQRVEHIFKVGNKTDEMVAFGKIFGHQLSETLTNILDFSAILSILVLVYSLVLVQSSDVLEFQHLSTLYFPSYIILFAVLVQTILSGLAFLQRNVKDYGQTITAATFNAKNHFIQVLLANIFSLILIVCIPLQYFPKKEFTIGNKDFPFFYDNSITVYDLIWCGITGQLTQLILVFLGEYFTSNGFGNTKNVALEQRRGTGSGFNQVSTKSSYGQGFILLTLGISIMICNIFGGFLGIAIGLIGLISTPILLLTITFFAEFSYHASELSRLNSLSSFILNNAINIAKGAQNYTIYLEIINASSIFYIDIILIGLTALYSKINDLSLWEPYTLLGFFFGACMVFILKANSSESVIYIAKEVRAEDQASDNYDTKFKKSTSLQNFLERKILSIPFIRICVTMIGGFILILGLAYLFGSKSVFGYIIGLNIVGINAILNSILIYNSSKNARNLNQEQQSQLENSQRSQQELFNSIQCNIATSNSEGKGLLLYLLFNTLFVTMGALQYWNTWGQFGEYLDQNKTNIAENIIGTIDFTDGEGVA